MPFKLPFLLLSDFQQTFICELSLESPVFIWKFETQIYMDVETQNQPLHVTSNMYAGLVYTIHLHCHEANKLLRYALIYVEPMLLMISPLLQSSISHIS